jgi:ribonuclease H2 subunit A
VLINPQVYVDALGPTKQYEQLLSSQFPGINFTVAAKADSKYTIVGAASVAAKVTRDAWIEGWVFEEDAQQDALEAQSKRTWSTKLGSGYPSGAYFEFFFSSSHVGELCVTDPNTKLWVQESLDRTFGYPSIARFSWTTIKVVLEGKAHEVKWCAISFGWLTH